MTSWNGNLDQTDIVEVKELLIGRKVVNVEDDKLLLDNGAVLRIVPNKGCGGCSNGWYYLRALNKVENAITDVEMIREELPNPDFCGPDTAYRIFVYAAGIQGRQTLLDIEGSDGNGYYGTGYEIEVIMKGRPDD